MITWMCKIVYIKTIFYGTKSRINPFQKWNINLLKKQWPSCFFKYILQRLDFKIEPVYVIFYHTFMMKLHVCHLIWASSNSLRNEFAFIQLKFNRIYASYFLVKTNKLSFGYLDFSNYQVVTIWNLSHNKIKTILQQEEHFYYRLEYLQFTYTFWKQMH